MTSHSELRSAILSQDVKEIERLLDQGADVDDADHDGITSLHVASIENYATIVQILISHGASINRVSHERNDCYTPLHAAIERGHEEIVKILLSNNADFNLYTKSKLLPLDMAVKLNHVGIARDLLSHGASVESQFSLAYPLLLREPNNYRPLHRAVDNGSEELVKLLIDNGAEINPRDNTSSSVYSCGQYKAGKPSTPLQKAIRMGHVGITKMLLEHGAYGTHVDYGKRFQYLSPLCTAMEVACELGWAWLYTDREYPKDDYKERQTAAEIILNLLLEHGAVLDPKKKFVWNGLVGLVQMGSTTIVERIMKSFPDVTVSSQGGRQRRTLLHSAVDSWNVKSVEFLIRHGANVNAEDSNRHTPIFHVAQCMHERRKRYMENDGDDLKTAELLLRNGANLDFRANHMETPFRHALNCRDSRMVHFLIMYNACVESHVPTIIRNHRIAARAAHVQFAEVLLNTGNPIDPVCFNTCLASLDSLSGISDWGEKNNFAIRSSTPLDCAANIGYEDFVKLLLDKGGVAIVNNNSTALYSAIKRGHDGIVKLLLQYGIDFDVNDEEFKVAMLTAVTGGHITTIKRFFDPCCYRYNLIFSDGGRTRLHEMLYRAVEIGHKELVKLLLSKGAHATRGNHSTPLCPAIENGHHRILRLLLDHGFFVDVNDEGLKEAMVAAVRNGHVTTIEHILKSCSNVSAIVYKKGRTLLHEAAVPRRKKMFELLIKHGYDMNPPDKDGKTPLLHALDRAIEFETYDNLDMVKYLLERGARADPTGENLETTIDRAIKANCYMLIELLLKYCSEVKMLLHSNDHPLLHTAIEACLAKVTKVLMKHGASVNATGKSGKTALHLAALKDHETVETLIEYGADIDRRDSDGNTALHIATEDGLKYGLIRVQVVTVLLKYGADINITNNCKYTALDYALQCNCRADATQILMEHLIKMKAANLFVSQHNLQLIDLSIPNYQRTLINLQSIDVSHNDLYNTCKAECEKMRKAKVADTNLSFYDVCTGIHYARNETVVRTLESRNYEAKFPLYSEWIKNNFERAQKRVSLLNQSAPFCNFLLGYELPEIVTMKIFNYLSNFDLQHLIEAYTNITPEKLYEINQRNERNNNVIIEGFKVKSRHDVEKEVKEFLEGLAGEEVKLESVRELKDQGRKTYSVRFAEFTSKLLIMKKIKILRPRKVFIVNELTERENEIKELLNERAAIEKRAGNKASVKHMELWLNGRIFEWDENTGTLVKRKTRGRRQQRREITQTHKRWHGDRTVAVPMVGPENVEAFGNELLEGSLLTILLG